MAKKKTKKIFVLDTNVPLHDPYCIQKFQEHDICIPIHLIEEIDPFKKGLDTINLNAREFSRQLDELSSDKIFNGGINLGPGLGSLRVILNKNFNSKFKDNLGEQSVDNKIINIAFCLKEENPDTDVILVSKDTNVRLKARALGIVAQDFLNEKVANVDFLSQEVKKIKVDSDLVDMLYKNGEVTFGVKNAIANQNFILQSDTKTALVKNLNGVLYRILKDDMYAFNLKPKNAEQAFAMNALLDPSIELVTIEGGAGTGKTIISLACALEQIDKKVYNQIFFGRKIISVGAAEIGFLPGDAKDKMDPYMGALKDNLEILGLISTRKNKSQSGTKEQQKIDNYIKNETLIVEALGFIRGRSLGNKFFIIDEAQNLTPHEIKTIVTRAGVGTKIILIGDTNQIDSPYLDQRSNGFSYLIEKFRGKDNYSHVHLLKSERSHLAEMAGKIL